MANTGAVADRKNAELRKKIEYQVACEERAHRIVERLIDNPVTQEQLTNALHYITLSHYTDIVEERAVSKLCGYPLCPNDLSDVPKQKFIISTKTNKVYDIESRKNFCSARCYKASKHLEVQVSSDPVWSRKNMQPTQFNILPLDMKIGRLGDEVIVSKAGEIKDDLSKLEKLDKYQKNLAERIHEHNIEKEKSKKAEKSEGDKNEGLDAADRDGEKTEEDGSIVYNLDKTMDELSLGKNENGEKDRQMCDKKEDSSIKKSEIEPKSRNKTVAESNTDLSENASALESKTGHVKKLTDGKNKSSKRKQVADQSKSKTDYLMQLLDKRKALLAKMADIQNDNPTEEGKQNEEPGNSDHRDMVADKTDNTENVKENENRIADIARDGPFVVEVEQPAMKEAEIRELNEKQGESIDMKAEKSYCKTKVAKKKKEKVFEKKVENGEKDKRTGTSLTALDLIFRGVQSWITLKTIEYLKVNEEGEENKKQNEAKTEFEKQYQDLVAKVDAQEKDFDGLLGEEAMNLDETENVPCAPLPHFAVLKDEMQEDQIRVREFMKGSFTYKVQEKQLTDKDLDGSGGVVLPTVDRYDQMLIRQKIVLDRISKVLPDVLSPLHLLLQDVFTELRELVCTFNLTSDNIVYKPAEWTIVSLILLRMLSRRMVTLQRSFMSPGAEKYFTVLLSGVGSNMDSVDVIVKNLLEMTKPRKITKQSTE